MALMLNVDGQRVQHLDEYRQPTTRFNIAEHAVLKQSDFPSAVNGYSVMLKPLEAGTHVIHVGGARPDTRQAVLYTLVVK